MNKIILSIAILAFPLLLKAQASPLDNVFDKYNGRVGYTTVSITKSMFELFSSVADDKEDKEFKAITARLNSIKILSCDCKAGLSASSEFYKEIVKCLSLPQYEDLMLINDGGEQVKFMIRKHGDKISELVMVASGEDACVISLQGDIDLKQVAKLSKSMNIKGLDKLSSVSSKSK